jgi:hypothetical protein
MMDDFKYLTEFGSSHPVRFLDASQVKAYDAEDNEIDIPICLKCGNFMAQAIGKTEIAWICWKGCSED